MSSTFVDNSCRHCGMHHGPACPRIKSIEYHPNGLLKRIEYFGPAAVDDKESGRR